MAEPEPKRVRLEGAPAASAPASGAPVQPAPSAAAAGASAAQRRPVYLCSAHEAVTLRLVYSATAEELAREISAGGKPFKAEFLHQTFGEKEEIRGYTDLRIDIWLSAQTYHAWVHVAYANKRPGADKLNNLFKEAFPQGYSSSQEEYISRVVAGAAQLPDLFEGGEAAGTAGADNSIRIRRYPLGVGADAAVRVGGGRARSCAACIASARMCSNHTSSGRQACTCVHVCGHTWAVCALDRPSMRCACICTSDQPCVLS